MRIRSVCVLCVIFFPAFWESFTFTHNAKRPQCTPATCKGKEAEALIVSLSKEERGVNAQPSFLFCHGKQNRGIQRANLPEGKRKSYFHQNTARHVCAASKSKQAQTSRYHMYVLSMRSVLREWQRSEEIRGERQPDRGWEGEGEGTQGIFFKVCETRV